VCRYPLNVNFIRCANSRQGSPDGTKRRLCLVCGALGQVLDEGLGIGEDSDALTSAIVLEGEHCLESCQTGSQRS